MSASLKDKVLDALRAARPIDFESGLAIATETLTGNQDEQFQFGKWYDKNGAALVKIINAGR